MEMLLSLDQLVFFFINHALHTQISDWVALFFSGIGKAGIVWFLLGVLLFFREERKYPKFFTPFIFAGISSVVLVEVLLKPLIGRLRPSVEMGAITVGGGSDGFSFPSGHATIAWTMAVLLSSYEPKFKWGFYLLAISISFSRIYLGVHYPSDVIVGGFLGWGIGSFILFMRKRLRI